MKSIIEQIIEKKKFEVASTSKSDRNSLVDVSFIEALDLEVVRDILRITEIQNGLDVYIKNTRTLKYYQEKYLEYHQGKYSELTKELEQIKIKYK